MSSQDYLCMVNQLDRDHRLIHQFQTHGRPPNDGELAKLATERLAHCLLDPDYFDRLREGYGLTGEA